MAYHFVAISSDYINGKRIGWHYSSKERLDKEIIQVFLRKFSDRVGDLHLGIHKLSTDSEEWESVVKKDSFFADVIITKNMDQFIDQVSSSKELTALDIAKFFLTICKVSHLKLQKMIYYAYAEYLLKTGKKLFKEPIVAFKYGPVVEDIFHEFKHHGSSPIDYVEDAEFYIPAIGFAAPSFIRMISSEGGLTAVECALNVYSKYSELSAIEMVNMTHRKGGPWERVYTPGANCQITDELIEQYHHIVQ